MAGAWSYSDWETLTDAIAKLARLRLHIQEVSDALRTPGAYSTKGLSVTREGLTSYLAGLKSDREKLEAQIPTARAGWTRAVADL